MLIGVSADSIKKARFLLWLVAASPAFAGSNALPLNAPVMAQIALSHNNKTAPEKTNAPPELTAIEAQNIKERNTAVLVGILVGVAGIAIAGYGLNRKTRSERNAQTSRKPKC